VEIIPTGIELERLIGGNGAAFRQRHGIPAQRPVLVHVGRVAFEKNIDFLLRMLVRVRADVPDVLLVVAGEGPSSRSLHRLARRLGLERSVLFVGYLDRRDALLDCYCAGDAFVFASRTETQGLVLLEAMALGLPVVSTAVMGTRDILEPGRGAVVPREDETEFAARVAELLRDPAMRARLSREAHCYAAEWSAQRMAARMLELYAHVLDAAGQRLPLQAHLGKTASL
jgi:glycosyltransferase involved in cell wall biosynthesis